MSRRPLAQLNESSDQHEEHRESIARHQEEQNTPNFDFGNIWVEIAQENLRDYDEEEEEEEDEEDDDNETEISSATESEDDDGDDDEDSESEMEVDDDLEEQLQESRND